MPENDGNWKHTYTMDHPDWVDPLVDDLKALGSLEPSEPEPEPKIVCLNCMPSDADFSVGFGHFGYCEKCKKYQMIYKILGG